MSGNHVRILGARGVTRGKFISDSPQMSGATAQNLVGRDARDLCSLTLGLLFSSLRTSQPNREETLSTECPAYIRSLFRRPYLSREREDIHNKTRSVKRPELPRKSTRITKAEARLETIFSVINDRWIFLSQLVRFVPQLLQTAVLAICSPFQNSACNTGDTSGAASLT